MCSHHAQHLTSICAVALTLASWTTGAKQIAAADKDFVGVLALAVEDDVATALQLSDEAKEKLLTLIAQREDSDEALELALRIKDLASSDQRQQLAPFVAESQRLGLQLLTEPQRAALEKIRIGRKGLAALLEPEVAKTVGLDADQTAAAAKLLEQRDENIAQSPDQTVLANRVCERQLAGLLSEEQKIAWENLVSLGPEADVPAELPVEQPADGGEPQPPVPAQVAESEPEPAAGKAATREGTGPAKATGDGKLRFSFRYAPWQDVLDWFATEAGLSLQADAPPPGTFNYTDNRRYTPTEAIDVINSILLTKGYTLVRREQALILINLEDGIPPNLVQRVPVEQLDDRGEFELVSVLFSLDVLTPVEAEAEVKKLLGPQGSVVVLPKAKQILVTETAGRLRTIRDVIQAVEEPDLTSDQKLTVFRLEHATAVEVLEMVRQLLGLPEGAMAAVDGSLRIAVDPLGSRLVVTGDVEQVKRVSEIVELADVPLEGGPVGPVDLGPQLEVYTIPLADPTTVLQVLQTLLAGNEDARLTIDEATGNLIALATVDQHKTIRATIAQMERDAKRVEVIRLRVVDPQLAVLSINNLFGVGEEGGGRNAPKVEAEPTTRQLLIRGTAGQITQIRSLLEKMGETMTDDPGTAVADRQTSRLLPYSREELRRLLSKAEQVWARPNRIVVDPPFKSDASAAAANGLIELPDRPPLRHSTDSQLPVKRPDDFRRFDFRPFDPLPAQAPPSPAKSNEASASEPAAPKVESPAPKPEPAPPKEDSSAVNRRRARIFFVADTAADDDGNDGGVTTGDEGVEPAAEPAADVPGEVTEPPVILVLPGFDGTVIASKDLDALDELESLLNSLAAQAAAHPNYTVFYLKHAKASTTVELLKELLGGGASGNGGGGGGGLLGDLAGAAMGDLGGGLLGGLLGLDGGESAVTSVGSIVFVPDNRLNAIFVQGEPADMDLVERLLRIIDQESSPEEVLTKTRPRTIPVYNKKASQIAETLRVVFAEQLAGGDGRQRQPSPEQFLRALRGGRGGGGESQSREEEKPTMTIGVDEANNLIIVAAPDALYQDVKALVEELDTVREEARAVVRTLSVKGLDPETLRQALESMTGGSVQLKLNRSAATPPTSPTSESRNSSSDERQVPDLQAIMRQRFFQAIQDQQRAGQDGQGRQDGQPRAGQDGQGGQGGQPRGPRPGFQGGGRPR